MSGIHVDMIKDGKVVGEIWITTHHDFTASDENLAIMAAPIRYQGNTALKYWRRVGDIIWHCEANRSPSCDSIELRIDKERRGK